MIQVSVGGCGQFECPEADIVESFVINAISFVGVLHKLVHGKGCIVRFYDGVGYLSILKHS